jgi:glycosyltransferase involved in cell wall biosynthesis
MPAISVIIPIYKVEPYICRCIDSVLAQTLTDFECILVDDGSPDKCPVICDEYAAKDKRFAVVHKEQNEGLPEARKLGLNAAKSEFVFHLDSDDWIEPNALELLFKKQRETDADIVTGGFRSIYASRIIDTLYPSFNENNSPLVYFFRSGLGYLWGRLYRRTLFNDYIVPVANILEDVIVNVQVFKKLSRYKIQFVNTVLYNYDKRTGGMITGTQNYSTYDTLYEYPQMKPLLWIKDYFAGTNTNEHELSAFSYFVLLTAVFPYLRYNKSVKKEDVHLAFQFYQNCNCLNLLSGHNRAIMALFRTSIFWGKRYVPLLNWVSMMKKTTGLAFARKNAGVKGSALENRKNS